MDLLLPGYEHQIVPGAGLNVTAGNKKVILHTTETGQGAANALISHWNANWGAGLPHFIIDGARCVQLLPLNVGGYTLENANGGADTNRSGPAVQVEICGYAANDFDAATYETVGKWLADLLKAGFTFDLENTPRWYGANEGIVLASYSSPIRMTAQQYIDFNGWACHQHCPENAHWDCGRKDTDRIKAIAYKYLGSTAPTPPASGDDLDMNEAELTDVLTKTVGSWEQDTRKYMGYPILVDSGNNEHYLITTDAGGNLRRRYISGPVELELLQSSRVASTFPPRSVSGDALNALRAIPLAGNPIVKVEGGQQIDVTQLTASIADELAKRLRA